MNQKTFKFLIGIDVSKDTLDLAIFTQNKLYRHSKIRNEPIEISQFISSLKQINGFKLSCCLFGMEYTGIYCVPILNVLVKLKAYIVQEHPLHIRRSLGITRGKNDKFDSIRIAEYLSRQENFNFWQPKREIIQQLSSLTTLRNRIILHSLAIKTPIKEDSGFLSRDITIKNKILCLDSITALKSDLVKIENEINRVIKSDEVVSRLIEIITSVPAIGPVTALQMIISTNEFKDIQCPKKFACYAGIAPFPFSSGTSVYKPSKVSHIANKKMKSLLHTCAVSAIRNVPDIKEYFKRKTEIEGRPKMLVLNAIRFKLVKRVFACVNNNRIYDPTYTYDTSVTICHS